MRVLIAQPWIRAGGAELLSIELSAALEAAGDEAPIAALFVDRHGLPEAAAERTYVLPPRPLAALFARSRGLTFVAGPFVLLWLVLWAGRRVNVLNPHNLPGPLVAAIAGPLLRLPVVWTCNEVPARLPSDEAGRVGALDAFVWRVGALLSRPAARVAREILVLSDKSARDVRATYGREATVVRAGVDRASFDATHVGTRAPLALLFVAKLHPQKDPSLAVRTLLAVRARGVDATLTIVGEGPERTAVEDLVAASGLEPYVRIERRLALAELVERYRRSDVLLVTAGGHQSWGLTPFEAILCGTPSVISAEAGVAESLGPADAALIVPRTADAFAAAAIRLRDDPALAGRLVEHGQRLASQLTWARYAEASREAFSRAMASGRTRSRSDNLAAALLILAVAGYAAQLAFFFGRFPLPWPDETLFAEPALSLLRDGRLASPFFGGLTAGTDQHVYWMPPGYFLFVALAFALAGPGLEPMRTLSALAGLVVIVLAARLARRIGGPVTGALAVALLVFDPVFVRASLVGRMDIVAVAFMLVALEVGRAGRTRRTEIAAGMIAACAALVHPLGAIGLVVLAARPLLRLPARTRDMVAGAALPLIAYGIFALQDVGAFAQQLSLQLDRKGTRGAWDVGAALRIVVDQYGSDVLAIAPPLAWITALAALAVAARHARWARLPLAALALALAAISLSAEMWYPLYVLPLGYTGLAYAITRAVGAGRTSPGRGLARAAAVTALVTISVALAIVDGDQLVYRWRATAQVDPAAYASWSADVARAIPAGARVLIGGAPDPAWALMLDRRDVRLSALLDTPRAYRYYADHLGDIDYVVVTSVIPKAWIDLFESHAVSVRQVTGPAGAVDPRCVDGWTPCRTLDARIYRLSATR